MTAFEFIGWTGAGLYIVAYFLLNIKKLSADNPVYQIMNILGGICLVINSSFTHDMPSLLTNAVWAGVAVFGIIYNKAGKG